MVGAETSTGRIYRELTAQVVLGGGAALLVVLEAEHLTAQPSDLAAESIVPEHRPEARARQTGPCCAGRAGAESSRATEA